MRLVPDACYIRPIIIAIREPALSRPGDAAGRRGHSSLGGLPLKKGVMEMRRVVLPLASMALSMLVCVGVLLALPLGSAQGAAAPTEPGFTDSRVASGLTNP